ncbi:hypothetical protein AMATHDRAFT_61453 [Amanita thiersii Skay4041]|uniref:BTB domain-containing protein n=1 Tax=Amanita thiersii Skay4041 TaxID=703135 RepID=A0A2A9NGX9_9AGAR|nr:hypothetical protein AMATHDRAFT_61453 [Amanita thiersii Skay4041]
MKSHLCFVSPVFDSLLSARGNSETGTPAHASGLPIVSVQENSTTLRYLFKMVYHHHHRAESQLGITCDMLKDAGLAVYKYKMTNLEPLLQMQMSNSTVLVDEPYRAYAVAVKFGWNDVVKMAAINTLHEPLEEMPDVKELDGLTGSQLFQLLQFRFKCVESAQNPVNNLSRPKLYENGTIAVGQPAGHQDDWFGDYLLKVKQTLWNTPCGDSVMEENNFRSAVAGAMSEPKGQPFQPPPPSTGERDTVATRLVKLNKCQTVLAKAIDKAISQVAF